MTISSSVAMIDFRALCVELLEAAEDMTVLNDDSDARLVAWLRDAAFDLNGSDPAKSMLTRAADLLAQRHPAPVPAGERLQQMEDLAADAVSALRYIEQSHGQLYGIGWDRVYEKADQLRPATAPAQPAPPVEGKVK